MDFWILFVLRASLMAIPLYVCNGLALVFGGGPRVDLGKNFFDGRPILGAGKTFRGTAGGIFFGFLASLLLGISFPETSEVIGAPYLYYGALLSLGAVAGDFAGSFAKRRLGIPRGESVLFLDQLDFVVGGLAFGLLLAGPSALEAIFLLAFTMLAHVLGNYAAFFSKIKKVPW